MADEERRSRPRGSQSAGSPAFLAPGGSNEEMASTGTTTCCMPSVAVEVVGDGAPQSAECSSPVVRKDNTMAEAAIQLTTVVAAGGRQPVISVSNSLGFAASGGDEVIKYQFISGYLFCYEKKK